MEKMKISKSNSEPLNIKVREEFDKRHLEIAKTTDVLFAYLFICEWIAAVLFAVFVTPKTWIGNVSEVHIHVYAAIFLGGLLSGLPIFLIVREPGAKINRLIVAVSQMMFSTLFIHLSGGRIETHFHVFGSLAFLSAYRDWRPLILATVITGLDHLLRGAFWSESVYGTLTATPWRALEHIAWVLFEDIILLKSIKNGTNMLVSVSQSHARLEYELENVENKVNLRTAELRASQKIVLDQQFAIVRSAKLISLGQMSAGIAHEINNPLSIISGSISILPRYVEQPEKFNSKLAIIQKSCDRIAKIVGGLKKFSRTDDKKSFSPRNLENIIKESMVLVEAKLKRDDVSLNLEINTQATIDCDELEILQVLVNLLSNADDAVKNLPEKWIKVTLHEENSKIVLRVIDSGSGVPENIRIRLFEPFFTTKEVGEGTGLGLSISKGIIEKHKGSLEIIDDSPNTCFEIKFPRSEESVNAS